MGNRLSSPGTIDVCKAANQSVTCPTKSSTPGDGFPAIGAFETNADIAGIGVTYAFVITALCTLAIATILLLFEGHELKRGDYTSLKGKQRRPYYSRERRLGEAVILSFSDQQIVTGLSMVLTVRYYLGCTISAYHYDIVCNYILMSIVTHLSSIAVVSGYFSNPVLGVARALLIVLTLGYAGVMLAERNNTNFPTGKPGNNSTDTSPVPLFLAPAACFTSGGINITNQFDTQIAVLHSANRITGLVEYVVLFTFTLFGIVLAVFYSYVSSPNRSNPHVASRRVMYILRFPLLAAAWGIALAAYFQYHGMETWLYASPWPANHGQEEKNWTFGQIMPLLLMMLAPLQFIEAATDWWLSKE